MKPNFFKYGDNCLPYQSSRTLQTYSLPKKEETLTNLALETKINYLIRILMDFICFDQLNKLPNELINLTEFTPQSYSGVCLLAFNANPGKRVPVQ